MSTFDLIQCTQEERTLILKKFGRDVKTVQKDIICIRDWLAKLPHLPQDISDRKIEIFLVFNKFSLEKAKKKIDLYYTIRCFLPEFYSRTYSKDQKIRDVFNTVVAVPLPKLYQESRIVVVKLLDSNVEVYDSQAFSSFFLQMLDLILEYNYSESFTFVVDMDKYSYKHLAQADWGLFKKVNKILEKVVSGRMKEFHMVHPPKVLDTIMPIVRAIAKEKYMEKIKIHPDLASLHLDVPMEVLPEDFGGDLKSTVELSDDWKKILETEEPFFQKLNSFNVDESLKPQEILNDEFYGFQGSFRKLDVD